MKEIKVEGKNIADALEKGLKKLLLRRDQVEVEVLNEGKKGILGIGGKKACLIIREKRWEGSHSVKPEEKKTTAKKHNYKKPRQTEEEKKQFTAGAASMVEDAKNILCQLLSLSGISFTVKNAFFDSSVQKIILKFESRQSDLLLQKQARGLEALQYLINALLNKTFKSHPPVQIDTNNFWERREKDIIQKIEYAIKFIRRNSRPFRFPPMSAPQRKFVHDIVKRKYPEYATTSEGEGRWRKVIIKAAK